jgi:hypothetical protein
LCDIGDPLAKRVFKEEIAKRLASGYINTVLYLFEGGYIEYLTELEIAAILEDPNSKLSDTLLKLMRDGYYPY